jgi:hypothetical protein
MRHRKGRMILCSAILIVPLLFSWCQKVQGAAEPNNLRWDLAGKFQAEWQSVELSAKLQRSAAGDGTELGDPNRVLQVEGRIKILDPNGLVAFDASPPKMLSAADTGGNSMTIEANTNTDWRWFGTTSLYSYMPVEAPMKWAEPRDLTICLQFSPCQAVPGSLSSLEWYNYALYADKVIEVKVPFHASDEWIQTETGLQFQVCQAELDCGNVWRYRTTVKSTTVSVRGLTDRLSADERIADYVILRTEILGASDYPLTASSHMAGAPTPSTATFYVMCEGESTRGGYPQTIRHVIAVHPTEVKIPFVLRDIPVPSIEPEK